MTPMHAFATYLKYFSDVVSLKSFSRAAERNFISQSAMSHAIKKLEEKTGQTLLFHAKNSVEVTPEGRLLHAKIQELIDHFDDLERFFEELSHPDAKTVQFGCMHSIALTLLPDVINTFKQQHPHAQIAFQLGNGAYLLHLLDRGEIDFAIMLDNTDLSCYHYEEVRRGKHEVFKAPGCTCDQFLLSESSPEARTFIKNYTDHYQQSPKVGMRIASWEVIARLTEAGSGLGYFPDYLVYERQLERVAYPFTSLDYRMVAVFKSARHKSTHAEAFLAAFG